MIINRWIRDITLLALLGSTLVLTPPARAQDPQFQPRFVRALSDLDAADGLLKTAQERGRFGRDLDRTEHQVGLAINDCRNAAMANWENPSYLPPPEVSDRGGRLREIHRLLRRAEQDISAPGASNAAWQQRSLNHIQEALRNLDGARQDFGQDGFNW